MTDALIGYTGFVGSTLLGQRPFAGLYNSSNIEQLAHGSFGTVVCAGAPGQKWLANQEPEADQQKIARLQDALRHVRCKQMVLISSVDVFATPVGVDESSAVDAAALGGYGRNRYALEQFVEAHFPKTLVVRLPGLVGPGLRKNALYDLRHNHRTEALSGASIFQFYPTVHLWRDIQKAIAAGLTRLHLTAEPTTLGEVAEYAFAKQLGKAEPGAPIHYDVRSQHGSIFGVDTPYQYGRAAVLAACRDYAQMAA